MDNRISSVIKRSLKVLTSYIMTLTVFSVFSITVVGLGKDSVPYIMPWLSFVIFWLLFFSVYVEMKNIAFKEKRPQYNLNPSAFKGLLYGLIGIIPIAVVQIMILIIRVPADFEGPKKRLLQFLTGPLYWIAKLFGNATYLYLVAPLAIIVIAFLGYYAGHYEFNVMTWIGKKLGKKKIKKGKA